MKRIILGVIILSTFIFASDIEEKQTEFRNGYIYKKGESKRYTGLIRVYFDNGNLKNICEYVDGEKNGIFKEYTRSGFLSEYIEYKNNKIDGIRRMYYPSGQIRFDQKWINGEISKTSDYNEDGIKTFERDEGIENNRKGYGKWFYENGKIERKFELKNGKSDGVEIFYYRNGKVKEKGYCKDGKRVGEWIKYDENGKVIEKIIEKDDNIPEIKPINSVDIEFDRSFNKYFVKGTKKFYTGENIISYTGGVKRYIVEEYLNGDKIHSVTYDRMGGKKSSEKKLKGTKEIIYNYNVDGSIFDIQIIDMRESTYQEINYYDNGQKKSVYRYSGIFFVERALDGLQEEYYENGNLNIRAEYKNGKKHGIYEEYNKNGRLIDRENYFKGERIDE